MMMSNYTCLGVVESACDRGRGLARRDDSRASRPTRASDARRRAVRDGFALRHRELLLLLLSADDSRALCALDDSCRGCCYCCYCRRRCRRTMSGGAGRCRSRDWSVRSCCRHCRRRPSHSAASWTCGRRRCARCETCCASGRGDGSSTRSRHRSPPSAACYVLLLLLMMMMYVSKISFI